MVDHAQGAQRFHQVQLSRIEVRELAVAGQHLGELRHLFVAVPGQQHPQVLNAWTHARVVEVHDVYPGIEHQHVAGVEVAVHPDSPWLTRPRIALFNRGQEMFTDTRVRSFDIGRDKAFRQQVVP